MKGILLSIFIFISVYSSTGYCLSSRPFKTSKLFQSTPQKSLSNCIIASLFLLSPIPSYAATYTNDRYHTTFNYPDTWTYSTGTLAGDRKVEAWVDPQDSGTSASLVISPIPADYTRLNSFGGGKETLREYLIPRGEGIDCTVVNEAIKGQLTT